MILLSPMPPCRSLAMLDPWLDHSPKTNMPNNCLLDDRKTKICLPCQAANDLAKTRAYPTLAPLLLLKKNAAGYVSIAVLKPCQIKKGLKYIWAAPKMVSFSATNYKKKTPYLLQLKYIFGFCYLTALTLTTLMPCPSAGPKGVWTCTKKCGLNQKF